MPSTKERKWRNSWRSASPITKGSFVIAAAVGCATIAYAFIAYFQLGTMDGTLAEMKRSGTQSTQQMWSGIGNINWLARSADWSQKVAKKQAEERSGKCKKQTAAQVRTATAAKNAAQTASETLHISQRAYISVGAPNIEFGEQRQSTFLSKIRDIFLLDPHILSGCWKETPKPKTVEFTPTIIGLNAECRMSLLTRRLHLEGCISTPKSIEPGNSGLLLG